MEDITNHRIQGRSESLSTSSYYSCFSSPPKCDGDSSASEYALDDLEYTKKLSPTPIQYRSDAPSSFESRFMQTSSQSNLLLPLSSSDPFFSSHSQTSTNTYSDPPSYTSQAHGYEPLPISHLVINATSDQYHCEDDFTRYLDNMLLSVTSDSNNSISPCTDSVHTPSGSNQGDWFWYGEISPALFNDENGTEDPGHVRAQSCSNPPTSLPGSDLPPFFYCESASDFYSETDPGSASESSSLDDTGTILSPGPSALLAQELIFGGPEHYADNRSEGSSQKSDRTSYFASSSSDHTPILSLNSKRPFSEEDIYSGSSDSDASWESLVVKKRKTEAGFTSTLTASRSLTSVEFSAAEPASLRKSSSLQSKNAFSEIDDARKHKNKLSFIPNRLTTDTDVQEYISPPTVPVTPTAQSRHGRPPRYPGPLIHQKAIPLPVPIIAPPTYAEIPKTSLSTDDEAEVRLGILLEKERGMRLDDGLAAYVDSTWGTENTLARGDNQDRYNVDRRSGYHEVGVSRVSQSSRKSRTLGIDENFRKEIIDWILQVLPMQPKRSHYDHPYVFSADLHDQLSTSPETRFHAAYMFIRYLLRAVGDEYEEIESLVASQSLSRFETSSSDDEQVQPRHMEHATKTIIWDVAVGCLALSVKLHRDFLLPLNPVYAMDFLAISPQDIAYDDLETSQRDILKAFGYSLGQNTPQSFMDELWSTLPSLRALLNFKNGWEAAQREAWEVLSDAICEPDILRFPVSLLTASALISGLVSSLVDYYKHEADIQFKKRRWDDSDSDAEYSETENGISLEMHVRKATLATKYVVADFRDVLGINHECLKECRRWLAEF